MKDNSKDQINQNILRKYIIYSRRYVHPRLTEIDKEKVTQFYADIRRESNVVGGISIAVRHIESVLRMSEAHAKMHLRDYVRADDIDNAIDMLLESFLQSQKVSVARQLKKKFEPYQHKRSDTNQLMLHTLTEMVKERVSPLKPYLYRLFMKKSPVVSRMLSVSRCASPSTNLSTRLETTTTTLLSSSSLQLSSKSSLSRDVTSRPQQRSEE